MAKLTISPDQFIFTEKMVLDGLISGQPAYLGIDLETTGLDAEKDCILSVALLFLDKDFEPIGKGIELPVYQDEHALSQMDDWCWETHTKSGLIEQVRMSVYDLQAAESYLIDYIMMHYGQLEEGNQKANLPMFGNSIYLDRRFLEKYMPRLLNCFHYRSVDVSTIKEIVRHQRPELFYGLEKELAHTALSDIIESSQEMKIYQAHFFNAPSLHQSVA